MYGMLTLDDSTALLTRSKAAIIKVKFPLNHE